MELFHHRCTIFLTSFRTTLQLECFAACNALLTYSNLRFNDLLCSSLSWTVLSLHAHPSGRYFRPFIDHFFCRRFPHSWSRHCVFQVSTLSISLRIAALCWLVSCCCRVLSVGEIPLDLTYYWSLWPVSLSPSVIHHVINAYTLSRLVINYTCNSNTFNLHSVCHFQFLTH